VSDIDAGALPGLAALVVVAAGIALGARSVRHQLRSSARLARRVRRLAVPATPEVKDAADRAGLG